NTPAPGSGWRSVGKSWSGMAGRSGSSRRPVGARPSCSPSPTLQPESSSRLRRQLVTGPLVTRAEPIEILLVEDSPSDVDLTREALDDTKVHNNLSVVGDGVEALAFLRREGQYASAPHPDLILLDLNLPKKGGREVLAEIKSDPVLRRIPVVVLTTSEAEQDIVESYNLHANCYVKKPVDLDAFIQVVRSIDNFWLAIVKLPPVE